MALNSLFVLMWG